MGVDAAEPQKRLRIVVAAAPTLHLIAQGVARALESAGNVDVVATASSWGEATARVASERPDALVVEAGLVAGADQDLAAELDRVDPELAVLVLARRPSVEQALRLFEQSGARRAYLDVERVVDAAYLVDALRSVVAGRPWLDAAVVTAFVQRTGDVPAFTLEEEHVLALVADGATNPVIASRLGTTVRLVERRIESIYRKLGLESSPLLARRVLAARHYALRHDGETGVGSHTGAERP